MLEFAKKNCRKNIQISNFTKIRQMGAELFHVDGRTNITKPIATFRNFVNEPNDGVRLVHSPIKFVMEVH